MTTTTTTTITMILIMSMISHAQVKTRAAVNWKHLLGSVEFAHTTAASSEWSQLCAPQPLCLQAAMVDSSPLHFTSSSRMSPTPSPYPDSCTSLFTALRAPGKPSIRQTTFASSIPQWSSQIVPRTPWYSISTRPSSGEFPPARRIRTPENETKPSVTTSNSPM